MSDSQIEKADQHVKAMQCLKVLDHRIEHHSSTKDACEACNIPERTFYHWMNQGVLSQYLDDTQLVSKQVTKMMVADRWEDILQHQIRVASGQVTQRGANPTSAAKFLAEIAGVMEKQVEKPGEFNATFFVQQVLTESPKEDGDVIDVEATEVE